MTRSGIQTIGSSTSHLRGSCLGDGWIAVCSAREIIFYGVDGLVQRRVDLGTVVDIDACLTVVDAQTVVAAYPDWNDFDGEVHFIDISSEPKLLLELHGPEHESAFHFGGCVKARGNTVVIQCRATNRTPGSKDWYVVLHRAAKEWHRALEIEGAAGLYDFAVDDGQCVIIGWQEMKFYRRNDDGQWLLVSTLGDPPSARTSSLVENRLAVGAAGDVYIYELDVDQWRPTETWRLGRKGTYPTVSVALCGHQLAVGNDQESGKIHLYQLDATGKWHEALEIATGFSIGPIAFDGQRLVYRVVDEQRSEILLVTPAEVLANECAEHAAPYTTNELSGLSVLWLHKESKAKWHFLAKVPAGEYGLLTKLKRRWHWFEGDWETLSALIPKEHLAGAKTAVEIFTHAERPG